MNSPPHQKVAAVVVLYNPEASFLNNIASYIDQVDILFAIDNSDNNEKYIINIANKNKIHHIYLKHNTGIANALNIGAEIAIKHGYNYLLTMDQDSTATTGMVETLLSPFSSNEKIGITSPFHLRDIDVCPANPIPHEDVLTTMTSGNILSLEAYRAVGPFMNELFIDFVDHEYCLRLQTNGYKIIQCNQAILHHKIGTNIKKYTFFNKNIVISNQSHIRHYYITRNRL